MGFAPKHTSVSSTPEFLRNTKGLHYTTGNITLDKSKLTENQVIKSGTAVFMNESTGLYELVTAETPATMASPLLTRANVKHDAVNENPVVSAISSCYAIKQLCTGVTDNFKAAAKGRITFD